MTEEKAIADKHQHFRLKIAISGAAETEPCGGDEGMQLAMALGREVVSQGAILVSGATTGFPLWASRAAKEAGGVVMGLSPAASPRG
jgi:predicted Rossmann-fold nucleotide-binding protein